MSKYNTFSLGEGHPPLHYRPGTSDEAIINEILIERKGYLLPAIRPKIVFDIGSNIGVAALVLANIYPEAIIHCFEPESENFELLKMNTKHLSRVVLNKTALYDFDGELTLEPSDDPLNHGGFSLEIRPQATGPLLAKEKIRCQSTAAYIAEHGCPDVIKIDCEGSEFKILQDVPDLSKVLWIAGELHNVKSFELLALLSKTHEIQTARALGAPCWGFAAANRKELFHKP